MVFVTTQLHRTAKSMLVSTVVGVAALASGTQAFAEIYYSEGTANGNVTDYYAMSNTGTKVVSLGSVDVSQQPFFGNTLSGQTYATIPGTSTPAPRFLSILQTAANGAATEYGELGYFTPNGNGGMTFVQLTNFYSNGWVILATNEGGAPQFSNDGEDSFVSVTVVDQNVVPPVIHLVQIYAPGANPAGELVTPSDPRVSIVFSLPVYSAKSPYTLNASLLHTWNSEGTAVAYVIAVVVLNPNGTTNHTAQQLRLRNLQTGTDTLLADSDQTGYGFFSVQWSPAPGSNVMLLGTSVINIETGVITPLITGTTSTELLMAAAWSPSAEQAVVNFSTYSFNANQGTYQYITNLGIVSATTQTSFSNITNLTGATKKYAYITYAPLGWR